MTIHWRALRRYPITTPHSRPPRASRANWVSLAFALGTAVIGGPARGQTPGSPVPCTVTAGTEDLRELGAATKYAAETRFRYHRRPSVWVLRRQSAYRDLAKAHALHEPGVVVWTIWPAEMGWGDVSPPLDLSYGRYSMNTAFGVGRGGLELHLMFSAYLATEGPILSRSREHSLVELLEMPATELGRVERASAAAFLRSIRIGFETGHLPWRHTGAVRVFVDDRPFLLLAGECLSLDWRGHAVEIAVGDLSADEPDRNQHHASRWAHVSFRVKWPSGVPLNGVPFRRWRPK
jgi:hypothetical protein